jgi:2-dehydropantoate 2-reductase
VRVCVVGCGAIGGLYAAHLATLDDVEVWAYDVSQDHVDAINRDGLHLTGHVELTAPVQARTDAGGIPPCELGMVATKTTFTDAAIAATASVFADGAVCSVQNGIGGEEVVASHVPRVIRGVCLPAGHVTAPGVVGLEAGWTDDRRSR